jgi:hypothetical protein
MFDGAWRSEALDYVWYEECLPLPLWIPKALTPDRVRFGLTIEGAGIESDRLGVCVLSLSVCLCVSDCLYVCICVCLRARGCACACETLLIFLRISHYITSL